jgi:hypothetical protein
MLISWNVWKDRNVGVFRHHQSTINIIIAKIKNKARLMFNRCKTSEQCNAGRVAFVEVLRHVLVDYLKTLNFSINENDKSLASFKKKNKNRGN